VSVTGSGFALVQDSDVECTDVPSISGTFTTSGNQLTLSATCPLADSDPESYTATSTQLSYGGTDGTSGLVYVFDRQ
jgi:hypothetical protein